MWWWSDAFESNGNGSVRIAMKVETPHVHMTCVACFEDKGGDGEAAQGDSLHTSSDHAETHGVTSTPPARIESSDHSLLCFGAEVARCSQVL